VTDDQHVLALGGCTPTPLASYLKGLAVLRLVGEQADPAARGWWDNDVFRLQSSLERDELLGFFLCDYWPTPLVAPWNGGSGFYSGHTTEAIDSIEASTCERLAPLAAVIHKARELIERCGLNEKPKDKPARTHVKTLCRNEFPNEALPWLDAAYLLTTTGADHPPLLGTGGNDGNLELTNNFMQRLLEVLDPDSGSPRDPSGSWLAASLFGDPVHGLLLDAAIGQFSPGDAGGPNAQAGYTGKSLTNPWDFILMLEGALLFATAAVRRLGSTEPRVLSYPFTVRTSGVGYGSASSRDVAGSRAETWLPLWTQPAGLAEVEQLLREGRATVGRRQARVGVDFARAVATLGVDRGIAAFERFGYMCRQGRSYLAVPLGRWQVERQPHVDLLHETDRWIDRFRRASANERVPEGFRRALRRIEEAVMTVCRRGSPSAWQEVVRALGQAERTMASSPRTTVERKLSPLPALSPDWLHACDDGSVEFRLACALASIRGDPPVGPLRANMIPLDVTTRWPAFDTDNMTKNSVVWTSGDLSSNLYACLSRRCLDAVTHGHAQLPLSAARPAPLDDIAAFIWSDVDETKIEELVWGLNAVNWGEPITGHRSAPHDALPASFMLLKLLHLAHPLRIGPGGAALDLPYDPALARRAFNGQLAEATRLAARRLRASGLAPITEAAGGPPALARRIAASLILPISQEDAISLAQAVGRPTAAEATAQ